MRRLLPLLCVGVAGLGVVGVAAGCGGSHRATATTAGATVASASCEASGADSKPASHSCTFFLSDGQRFRCGRLVKGAAPTVLQLERAGCHRLASLRLPTPVRRMTARLDQDRACLSARRLRVVGGPVLPPNPPDSTQPDGEIVISSTHPTFIAFYTDAARARRLAPAVVRAAARTHVLVERRGDVTIVWTRAPSGALRDAVGACASG